MSMGDCAHTHTDINVVFPPDDYTGNLVTISETDWDRVEKAARKIQRAFRKKGKLLIEGKK